MERVNTCLFYPEFMHVIIMKKELGGGGLQQIRL